MEKLITYYLIQSDFGAGYGISFASTSIDKAKEELRDRKALPGVKLRLASIDLPKDAGKRFDAVAEMISSEGIVITDTGSHGNTFKLHIELGDWKHSHLRADAILKCFGFEMVDVEPTGSSASDTYSAWRTYRVRKEKNRMDGYLCDHCGYEGSECPYPQESHCEFFAMRKSAFSKTFFENEFVLVYDENAADGNPYLECWTQDGDSFDVTSIISDTVTEPGELVLNHNNMHFLEFLEPFIGTMCKSSREICFGPHKTKTLAFKLRDDWRNYCFSAEEYYGPKED